jgi:RNA polymerase sigma-70 factor (ECF subfamily)
LETGDRVLAVRDARSGSVDAALVELAQQGDTAAFEALVKTRIDRLFRTAMGILGSEADARDATQEAFLSAWRQLPRLHDVDRFDAWLGRVLLNACRMALRHRRRVHEVSMDALLDMGRDPSRPVHGPDEAGEARTINEAFASLGADDRALLLLHHVDREPVAEIARLLGKPVGTVKWRLHVARQALDRALQQAPT